jgi:hypothetical protein
MIVLFHENVLLLSTNKFIVIPIKYRNFGAVFNATFNNISVIYRDGQLYVPDYSGNTTDLSQVTD